MSIYIHEDVCIVGEADREKTLASGRERKRRDGFRERKRREMGWTWRSIGGGF